MRNIKESNEMRFYRESHNQLQTLLEEIRKSRENWMRRVECASEIDLLPDEYIETSQEICALLHDIQENMVSAIDGLNSVIKKNRITYCNER